jgi:hypothetical protein
MSEALLGIQVISIFFGLFMIYMIRLHFKRSNLGKKEYLIWMFCWFSFIIFALFPGILAPVITTLKIVRVLDLLMVVAFMILTYLAFSDHMAIRDLYRQLNKTISDKAIMMPIKSASKNKNT